MKAGYAMFPQGNVAGEPDALPDQERMRRELRLVDVAGELGFDSLWVTEHHFGDYNLAPAPLTVLAYVAGRFPHLELGSMVVVLPWNDPLRVIEQAVVLDYLADGRFVLGIGKGEALREFTGFGMDLDEGRRRFETNLELVLEGLATGVLRREGEPDVVIRPAPRDDFRNRVLMAAGSPQSLDRAADAGLPLLRIVLRTWEEVAEQVERHAERFAAAVGEPPPPCVLLTYAYCDRDAGRARELGSALRPRLPRERDRPLRPGRRRGGPAALRRDADLGHAGRDRREVRARRAHHRHRSRRVRVPLRRRAVRGRRGDRCGCSRARSCRG